MSKIIIHVIIALIVNIYEFERANIATELLIFQVLLGFSYSMLINIISNQKIKLGLVCSRDSCLGNVSAVYLFAAPVGAQRLFTF